MILRFAMPTAATLVAVLAMSGCSAQRPGASPSPLRTEGAQLVDRQVVPLWSDTAPVRGRIRRLHADGGPALVQLYADQRPDVLTAAYRDAVLIGDDPAALVAALTPFVPGAPLAMAERHRLAPQSPALTRWRGALILLRKAIDQLANEHRPAAAQTAARAREAFSELADPWWTEEAALVVAVADGSATVVGTAEPPSSVHRAYREALAGRAGGTLLADAVLWERGGLGDPTSLARLSEQALAAGLPQLALRLALAAAGHGQPQHGVLVAQALLDSGQVQMALARSAASALDPAIVGRLHWQALAIQAQALDLLGHADEAIAVGIEALSIQGSSDDLVVRLPTAIRLLRQGADIQVDRLLESASPSPPADRRRLAVACALRDAAHGRIAAAAAAMNSVLDEARQVGDWSLIAAHLAFSEALIRRLGHEPPPP